MGLVSKLFGRRDKRSASFGLRGESPWVVADLTAEKTAAGAAVSESIALGVTSVWACVRLIAHAIAMLPMPVYRRLDPRGKMRAPEHPLYRLLHNQPCPELTAFDWRRLLAVHQNVWGAGIAEIEFDRYGEALALWPLPPWRVNPKRTDSRALYYEIVLDDGTTRALQAYRVLVFTSLQAQTGGWLSPIGVHRETIGMSLALTEFGAKTFGQGINPAGLLTHPGRMKEQSEEALRARFLPYEGLGRSHRLMFLEDGMKFERVGMPPEDAQYLQSRQFSISDIARIYNVPLHLLQSHEKSTSWGSGLEELNAGFVTYTLQPYLTQWEQEIASKLFSIDNEHFAEFLVAALLRGKLSDRYTAYATGRQWGWLSVNDVRELENMNPVPDGDMYLVPGNMTPADQAGQQIAAGAGDGGAGGDDEV